MHGRREREIEEFEVTQRGRQPRVPVAFEARAGEAFQAALVRIGALEPLEEGLAERDWGWVPRAGWDAEAVLEVDDGLAAAEGLRLEFDGLETATRIKLGRRELGRTENGLRRHVFDLSGLKAGAHTLQIGFDSIFDLLAKRNRQRALPGWGVGVDKDDTAAWVRTAPVHMGWDFAPKVVPVGVTGAARLVAFDRARIDGVRVEQEHHGRRVALKARVELDRVSPGAVAVDGVLAFEGDVVATARATGGKDALRLEFDVRRPELWWPNTYGEQPLYTLSLTLRAGEDLLDVWQSKLGLRQIELERKPDRDGEGFAFRVNGRRIDARGANWVPPEPVPGLGDEAGRTAMLLERLAEANATMVRAWGGGPVASETFYDH
ncbi:MAG: hypothetical protein AAFZ65_02150, partial [Planctomycetota bacterium]